MRLSEGGDGRIQENIHAEDIRYRGATKRVRAGRRRQHTGKRARFVPLETWAGVKGTRQSGLQ